FLYLLFTFPDVSNSEGNRHHFASRFVFLVSLLAYPSQGGAGFGERCLSTPARWSSLPVAEFAWWPHEQLGMRRPRGDLTPRVLLRSPFSTGSDPGGHEVGHLRPPLRTPHLPGTRYFNSATTRASGAPFTFASAVPYWSRETPSPYTCGHSPRGIFCNDTRELCRLGR